MKRLKDLLYKKRGSALVITMMVLTSAMIMIISISLISVAERKMSGKFKNSTPAFQYAESGIELAMKKIQTSNTSDKIDDAFSADPDPSATNTFYCGAYDSGNETCRLKFYDSDGNELDGSTLLSEVATIRGIGKVGQSGEEVSRAVESSVASGNCHWVDYGNFVQSGSNLVAAGASFTGEVFKCARWSDLSGATGLCYYQPKSGGNWVWGYIGMGGEACTEGSLDDCYAGCEEDTFSNTCNVPTTVGGTTASWGTEQSKAGNTARYYVCN